VGASGGDDAEPVTGLRTYAPKSGLLLDRAISIPDLEAAAAGVGGVRAVRAEWRWNDSSQQPVVQIWYIGAATLAKDVKTKLRGLSDGITPFAVEEAVPVAARLTLSIATDPKRLSKDVVNAVRAALTDPANGLLAPERIGIGRALFRSRIFEAVLAVPGAVAVTGLLWSSEPFFQYGIDPGSGKYFDFETGELNINGKAAASG
jgi:hypothetical protein